MTHHERAGPTITASKLQRAHACITDTLSFYVYRFICHYQSGGQTMSKNINIAEKQADWIHSIKFENMPANTIDLAKKCLLDFIGVALRGSTLPQIEPAKKLIKLMGGNEDATVIGGAKTSTPYAAYANGTFGHSCEFDDSHFHGGHPGVCVIPAALATGEQQKAKGKDLITAIIAGYQSMIWSVGPIHRRTLDLGWHGTKVGGVFGAAAATSKLLGLSSTEIANALAIAASDASGTMEYDQSGGEVKRFHAGLASRSGVQAALLAKEGLTGPLTIFEGKRGIYRLFSEGADPTVEKYWDNSFHILNTMFKMYPCAGTLHAALDCIKVIRERDGVSSDEIDSINVYIVDWAVPHGAAIVEPTDVISAQFSLAFSIGLQFATSGNSYLDYIDPKKWNAEDVQRIAKKVKPLPADVPADASELFARVVVTMKDGKSLEAFQQAPRGFPTNPANYEDLVRKFRSISAGLIDQTILEQLIEDIDSLETQEDLSFITNIFSLVT